MNHFVLNILLNPEYLPDGQAHFTASSKNCRSYVFRGHGPGDGARVYIEGRDFETIEEGAMTYITVKDKAGRICEVMAIEQVHEVVALQWARVPGVKNVGNYNAGSWPK